MKRFILIVSILFVITIIVTITEVNNEKMNPWIPALKETSFSFLDTKIIKALELTNHFMKSAEENEIAISDVEEIENILMELHTYYLPLTEVRELVYDSDRCYSLGKFELAESKLSDARKIILGGINNQTRSINKTLEDFVILLDNQIIAMQDSSHLIAYNFGTLGNRINLMLLKGELILSDSPVNSTGIDR